LSLVSHTNVKRALAIRLRELRRSKGWSQERLAEAADMHRTYLAGIERSLRNPALENLVKLANALGVTMAELFSPDLPPTGTPSRLETSRKTTRA
jgi:transcriptional regulator with XRE-family HTH domain